MLSASGKNGDARADLEVRRLHKWESDRKALNTAVELLSQGLDYRISEIEQQGKSTSEGVTDIVEAMLRSDDKLLSSLQKLGLELDTEDPEETESVAKLRDICARLIKYTVECLRTKLDRVYLEGLGSFPQSGHKREASKEDVTARQDELEELYSEILPVAQMSVEQQWLEPSLRSLSAKNGSSLDRSAEALRYVSIISHQIIIPAMYSSGVLTIHRSWSALTICSTERSGCAIASQRSRRTRMLPQLSWLPPRKSCHRQLPHYPSAMGTSPRRPEGRGRLYWTT